MNGSLSLIADFSDNPAVPLFLAHNLPIVPKICQSLTDGVFFARTRFAPAGGTPCLFSLVLGRLTVTRTAFILPPLPPSAFLPFKFQARKKPPLA